MIHICNVQLFAIPWSLACLSSLSTGLSQKEYWSGLPFPPPVDLPHPGIKPLSPAAPALTSEDFLPLSHLGSLVLF